MRKQKDPTLSQIIKNFEKGVEFKQKVGLFDTVEVNENFFIGKQWEGVQANGLPTPTYNFLKQVVNFQVATITSDNMAINVSPLTSASPYSDKELEQITDMINHQYAAIIERNHFVGQLREFMRNAAVDGDGCIYAYFDSTVENGQKVKGEIKTEIIENTRVIFGNPNTRDVQSQPYIILSRRSLVDDVQYLAEQYIGSGVSGISNPEEIQPDSEKFSNRYDSYTDDKVTVLTYLYRSRETNTIWCVEATEKGILRKAYNTKYALYPLIWLSWDYIQDCYHGQAMITGLIPNQKFINKMFAMVGISLMSTAFPKVIYDKTRIRSWDGGVGAAVGVQGNVDTVAKTIDGASVSPQIGQFIELAINKTRTFLGASDVAMGDSRPDNTSAIIALQRAANTPMEMTKQAMYQQIENMARIWLDMMSVRYGTRKVSMKMKMDKIGEQPLGMTLPPQYFKVDFDFAMLKKIPMAIKQDVGASSYWSEMANMQTLDNLLMNKQITLKQYLERIPNGYISKKQELIDEISAQSAPAPMNMGTGISKENIDNMPLPTGSGNAALQRAINQQGV